MAEQGKKKSRKASGARRESAKKSAAAGGSTESKGKAPKPRPASKSAKASPAKSAKKPAVSKNQAKRVVKKAAKKKVVKKKSPPAPAEASKKVPRTKRSKASGDVEGKTRNTGSKARAVQSPAVSDRAVSATGSGRKKVKATASKKTTRRASKATSPSATPAKLGTKPGDRDAHRPASATPYASISQPAATNGYDPRTNVPPTLEQLRKVKSGLTTKDLKNFRQQLLERRAEIIGDVQALEAARTGNAGEISHMPLHMADVGSDNYEQEFMLGLMESERKTIIEIDQALLRIVDRTYGVCLDSGKPIGLPRLEAKPWAKYCIEVARERERHGL